MASFWSKLQIPGFSTSKEHGYHSLLLSGPSILKINIKENVRFFWFRKSSEPVENGTGNCGKPPEPRIVEPCKGCPSKCLDTHYKKPVKKSRRKLLSSKKEPMVTKQKPSNCKEPKPAVQEKLTWWETIFGPDPKRSWPDPCTCRLAYRERKKLRARDPRLHDSRYKETAGDVYLYTEPLKLCRRSCLDPEPKAPPSFKVPKAVLYKMMETSDKETFACNTKENDKSSHLTPYRIPFEEMRPPEKRQKVFTCREGIRSEDVLKPVNRELNPYGIPPIAQKVDVNKYFKCSEKKEERLQAEKSNLEAWIGKRSRIEQLKLLVQEKSTLKCISSPS